jgi:hypothetical protein
MVLTVSFVVSPETGLLCLRHWRDAKCIFANLIPASGYQDATTSPSAISHTRLVHDPRPSHPASRFVTIAHTPLLPRRDGARSAADLQVRSTATDWHDGQISRWRENAVKEIIAVIACDKRGAFAQGSNATKQSSLSPQKDSGLLRFARNDGRRGSSLRGAHHGGHGACASFPLYTFIAFAPRNDTPIQ